MADVDPLKTQRAQTIHVGMDGRTAIASCQWLLENCVTHPITTGNTLKTFIGGRDGFASIASDLEAAAETIHLVCWGFDPGMALARKETDTHTRYPWARGEPYGELLKRKAASGVNVRLTLGSANLNQRSMAADSEINVATDNKNHNRALRKRVWGQLTEKDGVAIGGEGSPQEVVLSFERWQTLANDNKEAISKLQGFAGHIVKFEDTRIATDRVG